MIRFLILFLLLLAIVLVALEIAKRVRGARVDWRGIAFAAGFVVIAFWLRYLTGMG